MFSLLDRDDKTFRYIKRYLKECHNYDESFKLDNKIQNEEIQKHLYLSHCPQDKQKEEMLSWVDKNSKPFRDYLNSIKIAYSAWILTGHNEEDFTFEEFKLMQSNLFKVKEVLESIHN